MATTKHHTAFTAKPPIEAHWYRLIQQTTIHQFIKWQMTKEGIEIPNAPIIAIITNQPKNNKIQGISTANLEPNIPHNHTMTHILHNNTYYKIQFLGTETLKGPLTIVTNNTDKPE